MHFATKQFVVVSALVVVVVVFVHKNSNSTK